VTRVRFEDGIELSVRIANGSVEVRGQVGAVRVQPDGPYAWLIETGSITRRVLLVKFDEETGEALLQLDGRRIRATLSSREDSLKRILHAADGPKAGPAEFKAPMPGLIRAVKVRAGQTVQKGDALLILEAMKMENVLKATRAGEVTEVRVAEGDAVEKGAVLLRIS
jgi:biotin carboxyl carrier protein